MAQKRIRPQSLDDVKRNWKELYRVLRAAKSDHFDMSWWFTHRLKPGEQPLRRPALAACGTTACAAGHAAMDPYFRRRGLRLNLVGKKLVGEEEEQSGLIAGETENYVFCLDVLFGQCDFWDSGQRGHCTLREVRANCRKVATLVQHVRHVSEVAIVVREVLDEAASRQYGGGKQ